MNTILLTFWLSMLFNGKKLGSTFYLSNLELPRKWRLEEDEDNEPEASANGFTRRAKTQTLRSRQIIFIDDKNLKFSLSVCVLLSSFLTVWLRLSRWGQRHGIKEMVSAFIRVRLNNLHNRHSIALVQGRSRG